MTLYLIGNYNVFDTDTRASYNHAEAMAHVSNRKNPPISNPRDFNFFETDTRASCNGAEAMAYLSCRKNSVISDRLAILANLCGYETRLDTTSLDEAGYSFSVCALTLSVLNGDMSMVTGLRDVRRGRRGKLGAIQSDEGRHMGHGFSWCMPGDLSLEDGVFLEKNRETIRISVLSLSVKGLAVRGCLWLADRVIDVDSIRQHLFANWDKEVVLKAMQESRFSDVILTAMRDSTFDPYTKTRFGVRPVKAEMATQLICPFIDHGLTQLARQIWTFLRLRPTSSQLKGSQEMRVYAEAGPETILDVASRTIRQPNPIPSHAQVNFP